MRAGQNRRSFPSKGRPGRRGLLLMYTRSMHLFLDLVKINVGNSVSTIEDLGNLLQGWALSLDVDKINEDELAEVPELQEKVLAELIQ